MASFKSSKKGYAVKELEPVMYAVDEGSYESDSESRGFVEVEFEVEGIDIEQKAVDGIVGELSASENIAESFIDKNTFFMLGE